MGRRKELLLLGTLNIIKCIILLIVYNVIVHFIYLLFLNIFHFWSENNFPIRILIQ